MIFKTFLSFVFLVSAQFHEPLAAVDALTVDSTEAKVVKPMTITKEVHVSDQTDSTSTTTGAFKVDGGAGVQGDVHIGGDLTVSGTTTITRSYSHIRYKTGTKSIPGNNTETLVKFDSNNGEQDLNGDYDDSTGIFTVPADGVYFISCRMVMKDLGGTSNRFVVLPEMSDNGFQSHTLIGYFEGRMITSTTWPHCYFAMSYFLNKDDEVRIRVKHNSGSSKDINDAQFMISSQGPIN